MITSYIAASFSLSKRECVFLLVDGMSGGKIATIDSWKACALSSDSSHWNDYLKVKNQKVMWTFFIHEDSLSKLYLLGFR